MGTTPAGKTPPFFQGMTWAWRQLVFVSRLLAAAFDCGTSLAFGMVTHATRREFEDR
jgi:hypothetical protein